MTHDREMPLGERLDRALADKDWQIAFGLLEVWTRQKPQDGNGRFWIAYCLERLGRLDEARESALQAGKLDPNDTRVARLLRSIDQRLRRPPSSPAPVTDDDVPATEWDPNRPPPETETGRGDLTARIRSPETVLWKAGDVVDGRYEVREVRRGGMGEVYFVFDRALALDLAVKTPLPKTLATPSGRLRFLREAEAWIGLGLHTNICAAYYLRELGGVARLFIELIDGGGLDDRIKSGISGGLSQRLDLAIQVASGMQHAHTFGWRDDTGTEHHGLAHRDLKPANILIGSDGIARVTDFGLVGRGLVTPDIPGVEGEGLQTDLATVDGVWKTVTVSGGVMGTPPYMPPEQWEGGHAAGKPADVYAFGCILYELFCGRRPFILSQTETKAQKEVQLALLEEKHRREPPPDPHDLSDGIDNDLASLMLGCLEKEPTRRPASFAEIRQRLIEIFNRLMPRPYARPNPKARRLLGDALNNQGVSYATLGQPKRAEEAWEEALSNDPRHIEATFNLALFRWRSRGAGNPETLARMEEVLRGEDPPWKARHLTGKLCLAVGEWGKALDFLREAHHASNGMPEVARDFAVALCSQTGVERSIENFRNVVTVLTKGGGPLRSDPLLLTAYAIAMRELGETKKAESLYAEARRHEPGLPLTLEQGAPCLIPALTFIHRLEGFSGRVLSLSVQPSGRRAVTVLHDGGICLWEIEAGEIERMIRPRNGRPRCLALLPDGDRVLETSEGNPVSIWDIETAISDHRLQAHSGFLNALKITGDGRRAVGVGTTGMLNVWDLKSRSLVGAFSVHQGFLTDLDLSADCRTAITGGSSGKVLVVDLEDGEVLIRLERHQADVTQVAISQGGRVALSGDSRGEIRVWDLPGGTIRHQLQGHQDGIRYLAIDRATTVGLSMDSNGSLRLWDLESGDLLTCLSVGEEAHGAGANPDWSTVLVGHGPTGLSRFDLATIPRPMLTWAVASPVTVGEAEERATRFLKHLDDAQALLASGKRAAALEEIDSARSIPGYGRNEEALALAASAVSSLPRNGLKGAWPEDTFTPHRGKVNGATVSPSGTEVLSVGSDRKVLVWKIDNGTILHSFESTETPELACAFLGHREQYVSAGLDNVVHLWAPNGDVGAREFKGHLAQINDLATAGVLVLSGSSDQTARVWDTETNVCLQIFDGHEGEVLAVAMAPDGGICASSGEDQLLLWDPLTGRDILALSGHTESPTALSWSDDGRNLVSGARDGQLRLWDIGSGHCLRMMEVEGGIASLALSPDDRFVVTGGFEGVVQLWDIRSRRCLRTFDGHAGRVSSVAFSEDGQRCLSAGEDGSVRTWYLDWQTSDEEDAAWNDQAKPYLEVFLARHARGPDRPRWEDSDFRGLLQDLDRRRLGQLNPDDVLTNLERLAENWDDRGPGPTTMTRTVRQTRPVSESRRKAARKRIIRRFLIGAGFAFLLLIIGLFVSSGRLGIDPDRRNVARQSALEARIPYGVFLGPKPQCDIGSFRDYLEDFIDNDDDFAAREIAARCLVQLEDPRAVGPLLELLRSPGSTRDPASDQFLYAMPASFEEVLSILTPLGEVGHRELREALVDADEDIRLTAAWALAANGSKRAVTALVESAGDREPVVRIAVSDTLETIAAVGVIGKEEAFRLFETMAGDNYPEVRTKVALGLGIFRGSRPRRLLEALAQDVDADVRRAAEASLAALK